MCEDSYNKLARHLDKLPAGFPPTENGVEIRILKRFFTHQEAELALHLTMIPEEANVIARRAKISNTEAAERLQNMARKGLIFSIAPKGKSMLYMAAQFIPFGIWEYHMNDMDAELIMDFNEYVPTLTKFWEKMPLLRTVPVKQSINAQLHILPYEKVEELIRPQKKFLVAPCVCRREHRIIGQGCEKPEESCLIFGWGADYYDRNGIGRVIDLQETLDILSKAEEAGMVFQPSNAQKIVNICCCCGCCCQLLKQLKTYPKPVDLVSTSFVAVYDADTCEACGLCIERCQMDALLMKDDRIEMDIDRCIGCGLCVSTCPTDSIRLVRKPEDEQPEIPKDIVQTSIQLARKRGKLSHIGMIKMQLKSKLDRLLASKTV
jgi:Pyruvate/2-oxoacid:ferredoxin oxidoreductase delta subunit